MHASRFVLPLLFASGSLIGCDGGPSTPDAESPPPKKAEPSEARKAGGGDAPKTDAEAASESAAPKTAAAAGGEDWLIWFDAGEGVRTRWYTVGPDGTASVTAERKALVVANGEDLWHVRRKDAVIDVQSCMCLDVDEGSPECETTGRVVSPGLEAEPMLGSGVVPLRAATTETYMGEVYELSLRLLGGVGTRLFAMEGDSGFYCGAHSMYETGFPILDPTASEAGKLPNIELPRILRKNAAAGEMFKLYTDCEDDGTTLDEFVDRVMSVSDVAVSLKGGKVSLRWSMVAPVMYACSADYLTHGEAITGLLPAGEPLGLSDPLAPSLGAALAHVGDARVVGWSAVVREPKPRAEALAWFGARDETPWPAAAQSEQPVDDAAAPADTERAQKELARGRKLTRAGEYEKAVEALDAAIAADGSLARAWAARGYARLLDHKLDEAEADCEKALALGGSDRFKAAVFFNLGQVEVARKDVLAARAAYKASLELRENKEVRAALEAL